MLPFVWATVVLAAEGSDLLAALEKSQMALFERVAPTVVFISANKGFGSGFFVSDAGLILTNQHVVGDAAEVDVVRYNGERFKGRVLERGDGVDLALLQIEQKATPSLALQSGVPLVIGSFVAAVGHGQGTIWTFNVGMVSNVYPDKATEPVFQTQIPLNPGNSGGPIIDRLGRVVGVVTSGFSESNSINFGIKIDVALLTLSRLEHLCNCLVVKTKGKEPIFVDGVMVGVGPRLALPVKAGSHEVFAVVEGNMRRQKPSYPRDKLVRLDE